MADIQPAEELDDPPSVQNEEEACEEYAGEWPGKSSSSDRRTFLMSGMGARFERRLLCVEHIHGVALGTPLQTVKQSLTGRWRRAFPWLALLPVAWLWSSAANFRSSPNVPAMR